ncbi:sugar ABC transporter substrate-binding protein [Streptosporangium violaceochromogenes]|nr:sugar ABC transporter substrate-binding protein [Streptosporangium violaceochromogenes]
MPMNRRRTLAALSGLAAAALTGCAEPPLRVAVVWSGWELSRFREVLNGRETLRDLDIVVHSAGDDIATLLTNRTVASAVPDVAIVSQPGLLQDPAVGDLLQTVPSLDPLPWQNLVRREAVGPVGHGTDAPIKGVWFKAAHKSLIWHRAGTVPVPSTDWGEWVEQCRSLASRGKAPLSIAAGDGWTLTDWFENVLLGIDETAYHTLRRDPDAWSGPSVQKALTRLADLWSIEGLVPGGGRRALTLQFHDAVLDVFRHHRAAMVAAPDFAWPVIRGHCPAEHPAPTRFPWPQRDDKGAGRRPPPPVLVGGDVVVALRSGGKRALRFVEWLTGPDATKQMGRWAGRGGFLSVRPAVDAYPAPLRALAAELRPPTNPITPIAFDLSDRLEGSLAGGNGRGLWRVLTELFTRVAVDGRPSDEAVRHATAAVKTLAARGRPR